MARHGGMAVILAPRRLKEKDYEYRQTLATQKYLVSKKHVTSCWISAIRVNIQITIIKYLT